MSMQSTTISLPDADAESSNIPRIRATKRKLDDAFQTLDDAVWRPDAQRPPPPKRANTIRSLYSTLAKYGIRSKETRPSDPDLNAITSAATSKSTPHLTAILTRAASRTRKAFKFAGPTSTAPLLPPTAEYRPSSVPSFLSRLATFKLATYSQKPPAIDAVAAAKCGWINDGKDRLVCGLCKNSWVVAGRDGMSKDAANALVEKQRVSLVQMHKDGCPWKKQQCDPSIYRIPLSTPSAMVRDIKANAITLDPLLTNVEIKHPLTTTQFNALQSTISSFELPPDPSEANPQTEDGDIFMQSEAAPPMQPSNTAMLVSLFGWSLIPAVAQDSSRRPSLSRATSRPPSVLHTPSISRAPSVRPMTPSRLNVLEGPPMTPTPTATEVTPESSPMTSTPTKQPPPITPFRVPSTPFTFRMPLHPVPKTDSTLVHCALCQRRVGLWAFSPRPGEAPSTPRDHNKVGCTGANMATDRPGPASDATTSAPGLGPALERKVNFTQRQLDLLKEHRSYCPYVVRSTIVPILPVIPVNGHTRSTSSISQLNGQLGPDAVEGWRAVLTVVLRYGAGQRKRMGLDLAVQEPMEVDDVKAMVEGVKSHGGKDLLRYVKGLLA